MSRRNWTRVTQVILIAGHIINGGLAAVSHRLPLAIIMGLVLGSLQLAVLEMALKTPPPLR